MDKQINNTCLLIGVKFRRNVYFEHCKNKKQQK